MLKFVFGAALIAMSSVAAAQDSSNAGTGTVSTRAGKSDAAGDAQDAQEAKKLFGRYRIKVALAKPSFSDDLKFFDKLYGDEKLFPQFSVDWFPWDWYATVGLTFRFAYYTQDGYAAKSTSGKTKQDLTPADVEKDLNGPTSMTLIPIQAALAGEFTPFSGKWVVFDAWIGIEELYFQEVRTVADVKTTSATSTTGHIALAGTADSEDSLTNKGWKTGTTLGVSANILLNPLDERSAYSMRNTMGIGSVYASPYMEYANALSKDGVGFSRVVFGLGFTFETIR